MRIDTVPEEGGLRLEFEGDGFLYKMVRNITGTALEMATGKRPIGDIPLILQSKDRKKAGKAEQITLIALSTSYQPLLLLDL